MGDSQIYVSADDLREMQTFVDRGVDWLRAHGGKPVPFFIYTLRRDDFGAGRKVSFLLVKYERGVFYESLDRVELDGVPNAMVSIQVKEAR